MSHDLPPNHPQHHSPQQLDDQQSPPPSPLTNPTATPAATPGPEPFVSLSQRLHAAAVSSAEASIAACADESAARQACDAAQKALHVATRQVIDTGLALAKPRECKDDDGVQLSRNAFKNWVKQLAVKDHWASSKLVDKCLKQRLRILKEESVVSRERIEGSVEGESSGFKRSKGAEGDSGPVKKQKSNEKKALAAAAAVASSATVVVDLSYEDLMTDKESASLATQVISGYAFNKRCIAPLRIAIAASDDSKTLTRLRKISGFSSWRHCSTVSPLASTPPPFATEKVVYLSSESSTVLQELKADTVYVIGGLVDHNKHLNLSNTRAIANGISTARLPLDDHAQINGRRVLAVNHVMHLLMAYNNCGDWPKAIDQALPKRKVQKAAGGGGGDADCDGDADGDDAAEATNEA